MNCIIREYRDTDQAGWDHYVQRHPQGTFFHLIGWKKLVEKAFGHQSCYLIAGYDEKPGIAGVLPLFAVRSLLFGNSMVSVPFAVYGGILADNEAVKLSLLNQAITITRQQKLAYLEIRNEHDSLPNLLTKDLYYVFQREILVEDEKNMQAIPRKTRRMIRQGIKHGLQSRTGRYELLDSLYHLIAANYHRLGTPVFSKNYFRLILDTFPHNCSILLISHQGVDLSGVMTFYYQDKVIPYYSGAVSGSNQLAANDFLYWALMCESSRRGCRVFDFGRSKINTGPYHFKRHWGFEPKRLEYQYWLNTLSEMPYISPANPKYQRRIELWRKIPQWVANLIGPHIIKNIP